MRKSLYFFYVVSVMIACNTEPNKHALESRELSHTDSTPSEHPVPIETETPATTNGDAKVVVKPQKTGNQVVDRTITQKKADVLPTPEKKEASSLKTEAKKFCDFFKTYEEPSQFYTVPASHTGEVSGKAGTIISINPDDLQTLKNQPVTKAVEVELKELTKQDQLLRSNAQTVCDGKQLVSGGAYFINLKSDGEALKLKPGKSLSVKFPQLTDAPMALFAGYRDSLGQMQWQTRKQKFIPSSAQQAWRDTRNTMIQYDGDILEIDTLPKRNAKKVTEQEKKRTEAYQKVYAAMEIQALGWVNCDRFYNVPDKTTLSINVVSPKSTSFASIYLVFEEMNSIMQTHFGATVNGVSNPGFENIPVGAKVKLVAFSLKDDKMLVHSSRLTVKKDETISLALKETSDEELKDLLGKK